MSSFANEADAAAALAASFDGGNQSVAPTPVAPVDAPVVTPEQAPADAGTANQVDAGTNLSESPTFDINSVPEALRPQVQELLDGNLRQADYTRKTQEIAPIRQIMQDTGMTAEEAQQALTFVQSLNDPAKVQELYQALQEQFGEAEPGEEVDPRDQELQSLSQRLATFEEQQATAQATAELSAAQQSIKAAYPSFSETDHARVEALAVTHMQANSNNPRYNVGLALEAAAKDFASWRDETITAYLNSKGQASTGTPVLGGNTAHAAEPPKAFANLDEATKAALARFGNQDW